MQVRRPAGDLLSSSQCVPADRGGEGQGRAGLRGRTEARQAESRIKGNIRAASALDSRATRAPLAGIQAGGRRRRRRREGLGPKTSPLFNGMRMYAREWGVGMGQPGAGAGPAPATSARLFVDQRFVWCS
ncbi:hypothetical protein MARPO_0032s0109 [Marchantia polymorpha]|uniref:Uncharacterized protein n=1 Tax=Marchantia polymorpha TaxID=3197 RepID=A0A2R6X754_MARPO|nr:hypothetical protein MARPO_0032s0109 [Marchantia polymorpha]|eukprot:PTQ41928.1 hypothetical protein MARPO_0032s0109 [Marchantia polymorpha]